jgi:hypothetical protein
MSATQKVSGQERFAASAGTCRSRAARWLAATLCAAALMPAQAAEGYAFWDTFDAALIDARLWLGTERHRMRQDGALRFVQRDLGLQISDAGTLNSSWDAKLKNPAAIQQMRAVVSVSAHELTGCATNPSPSFVQARLFGSFFNVGAVAPDSRIGDVIALLRLVRYSNSVDPAGTLRAEATLLQCTTSDCNYDSIVLGLADLGPAASGEAVTLKFDWEPAAKRFNFTRGSNPVVRLPYSVSDAQPPFGLFRQIGTRTNLAHCRSGTRTAGLIDAKFDNISVNASAAP